MKYFLFVGLMLSVCVQCFSAPPPHEKRGSDGIRTANGILDLVDKGLHILSPKPQPPPTPAPVAVPAKAVPAPVIVCAYPENSYVAPVVAPWNAVYVIQTPAPVQPPQVIIAPAPQSEPQPLPPAKVPWR